MYYEDPRDHGLGFDPFKAIIAPRPIGWISTIDTEGRDNLAPYSFFTAFGSHPHTIGFSSDGMKDSAANAVATGEFVYNLVTRPLVDAMNRTSVSLPPGHSESLHAGLDMLPSNQVRPLRVAHTPAALECRVVHHFEVPDLDGKGTGNHVVIGQVVGIHIDEAYVTDGRFDMVKAQTVARSGYRDYVEVTELFELQRPDSPPTV
ncbi:flavin reductase family protein [Devosia sp.]|uniref:flavin reductase family protein n=1 Tax=Devosia sp. TaxID=1871048 RepID=UPI003A8F81D7